MRTTTKGKTEKRRGTAEAPEHGAAGTQSTSVTPPQPPSATPMPIVSLVQSAAGEIERWLADLAAGPGRPRPDRSGRGDGRRPAFWMPPLELVQQADELVVRSELPGMRPEDVHVTVDDHRLRIWGERREEQRKEGNGLSHTERFYGAFSRTIPLPEEADVGDVSATLREGVLEIRVPTPGRKESQEIPVRT